MQETETEIEILENYDGAVDVVEERTIVHFPDRRPAVVSQPSYLIYLVLPTIFLIVTLLGGLRLGAADNAFVFLKPALVCLVFAALTVVLYVRSGMISVEGWIAEDKPVLENGANIAVLFSLFTATVQLFSSLLPEQGLTFWVVGFCFFWTIWNNLFAEFDAKRLLRSMFALFGLAFVVKYLVFANITAAPTGSWWQRLFENPGKEAFTWLLELPKYSAGTGYIQFFTLALYLIGLFLLPRRAKP
ncbi:MAG: hypothetical protein QM785_11865 [Pyrinomonadaceae bacterium]